MGSVLGGLVSTVKEVLRKSVITAVTRVPKDVWEALHRYYEVESELPRRVLEVMLKAVYVASRSEVPLCQDTGIPTFFIRLGRDFPLSTSELEGLIRDVISELTSEGFLRPNAVDPFTNTNSGNNLGKYFPVIHTELTDGDELDVTFVAKGGGSEYVSQLCMVPPSKGIEGVKECVLKSVIDAGPKPCPPVIIGVGIAGSADVAELLSRKALYLRRVGERHREEYVAKLELELLREINKLGLGPMGLGGLVTALDVHVEYGFRHPATLAVAITYSCWALRRSRVVISSDGRVREDPNDFWLPPWLGGG